MLRMVLVNKKTKKRKKKWLIFIFIFSVETGHNFIVRCAVVFDQACAHRKIKDENVTTAGPTIGRVRTTCLYDLSNVGDSGCRQG
jgi:hypothetical protein